MTTMTPRVRLTAFIVWLGATALIAGQTPPAAPQTQQPTFKVQVDYVEVDALVTDRTGTFVRDLTKEDFQFLLDYGAQNTANWRKQIWTNAMASCSWHPRTTTSAWDWATWSASGVKSIVSAG